MLELNVRMSKKSFRAAGARAFAWSTISAACVLGTAQTARAQLTPPAIPELDEGAGIITNKQIAIALGKARDAEAQNDAFRRAWERCDADERARAEHGSVM